MKFRKFLIPLVAAFALAGCDFFKVSDASSNLSSSSSSSGGVDTSLEDTGSSSSEHQGTNQESNDPIEVPEPEVIEVVETTGDFSLTTEDGSVSQSGSVYTISAAGTYVASGKLEGQILVNAGEDDEVVLELNEATIIYDKDSPIKAVQAGKLDVSAKKSTGNVVSDNRSAKAAENENLGEGAISAKCDLKLKGAGTLVVTGNYNNGVHTTKDLTIQKETLKVTALNNAIKGKNSVTIDSGTVQAYCSKGDGIVTVESDLTSKGKQKGTITINGGEVYVESLHDALESSYDIVIDQLDSEVPTTLNLKTGSKSSFGKTSFTKTSEKGLKAENEITINNGSVLIAASDDAIHVNYGTALGNGSKGAGNLTVNGGSVEVAAGDDGLHSDNNLIVNGGVVRVTGAKEGIEGNYITFNGGETYIYGTDDGVNCSKKSFNNCSFTMNGGYLDVAVAKGDTDGIDSNGNVYIKDGIIVTRGGYDEAGNMSTGLDVDGTCQMTGGTLIAFNGLEKVPTTSSGVLSASTAGGNSGSSWGGGPGGGGGHGPGGGGWPGGGSSSSSSSSSVTLSSGAYTLVGDNINIGFTNDYSYQRFCVYSNNLTQGSSYTLSRNSSAVLSWTQSSTSVTIS